MFRSAIFVFLITCLFIWKSKVMAFIIYHFENGIRRFFGYSSYVYYFFYLAYFTLVAIFTIEYVYQIYSLVFAPFGGFRYDSIRTLHAFAEILEQEDILISVRNLYTSESNYEFESYLILPRLKSDQLPQTEMLSSYKKMGHILHILLNNCRLLLP